MTALRIAHVAAPSHVGGLETVILTLARLQRSAGHEVLLVTTVERADHPFVARARSLGLDVAEVQASGRAYLEESRLQREALSRWRPSVVHTHGYRADLIGGWSARRLQLPRVSTAHGFTGGDWRNRLYERLQIRSLRKFDVAVGVSQAIRERLEREGVPADRTAVVPNAWAPLDPPFTREEARARLGIVPDAWVMGWVGRINRTKGLDVLLAALPHLAGLPIRLSVLGDGPDRAAGAASVANSAVPVTFHGMVPDGGRYFRAFDLFVLSSRSEGTPMVGLDAMGYGIPAVVTAVGGVPDLFGDTARLVPPEQPEQLAAAIRQVHADPAGATAAAARGVARIEAEYGGATWVARYDEVYNRAISRAARNR